MDGPFYCREQNFDMRLGGDELVSKRGKKVFVTKVQKRLPVLCTITTPCK
jgi:hypothetical protein